MSNKKTITVEVDVIRTDIITDPLPENIVQMMDKFDGNIKEAKYEPAREKVIYEIEFKKSVVME